LEGRLAAFESAGQIREDFQREGVNLLEVSPSSETYRVAWRDLRARNAATLALEDDAFDAAFICHQRVAAAAVLELHGVLSDQDNLRSLLNQQLQPHAFCLRDIFGNPFHPLSFNPSWQTTTVQQLADAIYQEKAFDRLPILADALEDAGCDSTDLLNHLRQPGEHVRGCWALDLVLGKE